MCLTRKIQPKNGITLINLIITIIILLILAGVTINVLVGGNGIFSTVKQAGEEYKKAEIKDRLEIAILDIQTETIGMGNVFTMETIIQKLPSKIENTTIQSNGNLAQGNSYGYNYYIDEQYNVIFEKIETKEDKYIEDGLIVLYDGENNTGTGHSNTTTKWRNLASQNSNTEKINDGILMNIDFNNTSGWTNNSLILDGIDDWVKISYLYYENMTVEIVAKPLEINETKNQKYICNFQSGGIGIQKSSSNYLSGDAYIVDGYKSVKSSDTMRKTQIYSMSIGYNGMNMYLRENEKIYKKEQTGKITPPTDSTVFAIGTNPKGDGEALSSNEDRFNIEVYSVRIYSKCLTEEEIQHNYEIDIKRFGI